MTKTEYTAAIAATQTAISSIRTDLRKLRTIEKMAKTFPDLKLVDSGVLDTAITEKKAKLTKLRSELSKARRIVKRMAEIEDIETGKVGEPKAKKASPTKKATEKKGTSATAKAEAGKTKQSAPIGKAKENTAA